MLYDTFNSPLGTLTVATNGTHITQLHIADDRYFKAIPPEWQRRAVHPLLLQAKQELEEYFACARHQFDLPLAPQGTAFQQAVWKALQQIAPGATTSYGQLAASIGKPRAVRAVGTAVGRNPICIIIPCHRVLASDGSLGGYVAGLQKKQALLSLESR